MRAATLFAIDFYQARLSSRKGFKCAYGVLHGPGAGTCSSIVKSVVRSKGTLTGAREFVMQISRCAAAAAILSEAASNEQAGSTARSQDDKQCDDCMKQIGLDVGGNCCAAGVVGLFS